MLPENLNKDKVIDNLKKIYKEVLRHYVEEFPVSDYNLQTALANKRGRLTTLYRKAVHNQNNLEDTWAKILATEVDVEVLKEEYNRREYDAYKDFHEKLKG